MDAHHRSVSQPDDQDDQPLPQIGDQSSPVMAAGTSEQAERAAMLPELNDLEWRYYHGTLADANPTK